jgi:hypothetical protein
MADRGRKKQIMSQKTGAGTERGRDESTDHEQDEGVFDGRMYGGNGSSAGFGVEHGHGHGPGHGHGGIAYGQDPISAGTEPGYPRMMNHVQMPSRTNSTSTSTTGYTIPELSMPAGGIMPPSNNGVQEMWNPPHINPLPNLHHNPQSWGIQPLTTIPPDQSLAVSAITESTTNADGTTNDATFEDVWRILFGDNTGFTPTPSQTPMPMPMQNFVEPDPTTDLPLLSVFSPSVYGAADNRHVEYLHHYLNIDFDHVN